MERWRIQPGAPPLETEKRADGDDEEKMTRLRGYATVYGVKTVLFWGQWREIVHVGAYDDSVRDDDIRALWQHDSSQVLGRVSAGTMRVWSDDVGVGYTCDPPTWAAGYVESVDRGDVTQSSIGFDSIEDSWEMDPDEEDIWLRTVIKAKMWEASPVTWAAVQETVVGVTARADAHRGVARPQLPIDLEWREEAGRMIIGRRISSPGVDLGAARAAARAAAAMADMGSELRL